MGNIGNVSAININGNEMTINDAAVREVVNEIISAIGANNSNIAERINDLHKRSFDYTLEITSNNESEIVNIQDGIYKLHYVTVTGSGDNEVKTLNNSAILIQNGINQYLYKDGQLSNRLKTDNVWGEWQNNGTSVTTTLSSNYEMSPYSNSDLSLESGDTYEEAFGKIEKAILDNEEIIANSLIELNSKINNVPIYDSSNKLSADLIENGETNKVINIKPNWDAAAGSDAEILNKPDLSNFITQHQSIKTINNQIITGEGNVNISGLPSVTASDNGKILMVVNGEWALVSPSVIYSGNALPNNANGNNGDLYIQTD